MKQYNNIDEFFKEKVSGYKVTPTDKVWDNIKSEYFKTKSTGKRYVKIGTLVSLILIVGGVITWTMFTNKTEQNSLITNKKSKSVSNNILTETEITDKINSSHKPESNSSNDDGMDAINSSNRTQLNKVNNSMTSESDTQNLQTNDIRINIPAATEKEDELVVLVNNKAKSNINIYPTLNTEVKLTKAFQINKLSRKNTSFIENSVSPSLLDNFDIKTVDEYIEKRRNLHFYTGASSSIAMVYYSATTDQSSWSADLVYGIKLKQFYVESGIGFQKMKEQGTFQIDYKTNDSIGFYNKVVSFELDPNNPGEITYKISTTTVFDSIEHHLLQSPLYYYDYIVVPIKFGYSFFQNQKFSVSGETGIIYCYLTKTYTPQVQYNDPDSQLIGVTNNTPERVDHNFRVHIALRLNYNITKTVSLSAQPEFTSFINSIYNQSYGSKVRPYTMGIRFGICFDF